MPQKTLFSFFGAKPQRKDAPSASAVSSGDGSTAGVDRAPSRAENTRSPLRKSGPVASPSSKANQRKKQDKKTNDTAVSEHASSVAAVALDTGGESTETSAERVNDNALQNGSSPDAAPDAIVEDSGDDGDSITRYPRRKSAARNRMIVDESDSEDEASKSSCRARKRVIHSDDDDDDYQWDPDAIAVMEKHDAEAEAAMDMEVVDEYEPDPVSEEDEYDEGDLYVAKRRSSSKKRKSKSLPSAMDVENDEQECSSIMSAEERARIADRARRGVELTTAKEKLSAFGAGMQRSTSESGKGASLSSSGSSGLPPTMAEKKRAKKEKFEKNNVERYSWLMEIRDANRRLPSDPLYDPTTLYVPDSAYNDMTAFEQQFWDVKRTNMDAIVFFKKGKFYELYEMDADVGHKEFDLKVTDRVNMKMAGVPEHSFELWASRFLSRGYKITRVDQVESSLALAKRKRRGGGTPKKQTIIQREVSQILTAGTLMDPALMPDHAARYLFTLLEAKSPEENHSTFACCVVDCAAGQFHFHGFVDDKHASQLETLLVRLRPAELILDKEDTSEYTRYLINRTLRNPVVNNVSFERDVAVAAQNLKSFFRADAEIPFEKGESSESEYAPLHTRGLAATLEYLKKLKIAGAVVKGASYDAPEGSTGLILDGQTLLNLEIVESTDPSATAPTLLSFVDHCVTPFGKRLLRRWLCEPLKSETEINARLDVVEELHANSGLTKNLRAQLRVLPDLERLLGKLKNAALAEVQSAGTVQNFVKTLEGMKMLNDAFDEARSSSVNSELLARLIGAETGMSCDGPGLRYPQEVGENLRIFMNKFDRRVARETGEIDAKRGADTEFDACVDKRDGIIERLEKHLQEQKKALRCSQIKFVHKQKDKYQIEIPKSANVSIPSNYLLMTETKTVHRFSNPCIQELLEEFAAAEEELQIAREGVLQRILNDFVAWNHVWTKSVACAANLDGLMSLSQASYFSGLASMCRPQFVPSEKFVLHATNVSHPLIALQSSSAFVPNDIELGDDQPCTTILTGPNMGGKSTLLRQVCLLVVLAQLGCFVPASSCRMSVVDRIFTRIGANDNIFAGHSTFMVELMETNTILQHATPRSLVILDELGRGTSTYDGYAIAFAVLQFLVTKIGCGILFSTHYHMITEEFRDNPQVTLQHMSCRIDEAIKEVVYLYKMTAGVCPRSYGMNVARAAGVDGDVVLDAHVAADVFESSAQFSAVELRKRAILRKLLAACEGDTELAMKECIALMKTLDLR